MDFGTIGSSYYVWRKSLNQKLLFYLSGIRIIRPKIDFTIPFLKKEFRTVFSWYYIMLFRNYISLIYYLTYIGIWYIKWHNLIFSGSTIQDKKWCAMSSNMSTMWFSRSRFSWTKERPSTVQTRNGNILGRMRML